MQKQISVIGSGIGGLASAIRMKVKGHEVDVFENSSTAGGKISELHLGDFRFDTGPSLLTMPWLIDELFELAGADPRNYFNYKPCPSTCKYFWEDGTIVNAWSDPEEFANEASIKTGISKQTVLKVLDRSRELYEITGEMFLFNSIHKASNYRKKAFLNAFLKLHRLDALTTMHSRNLKTLKNKHMTQLFDRYATYNGSNPYNAPATLNIIAHLEHNTGVFFPENGIYSIVKSLVKFASEIGVRFHFNSAVQQVIIEHNEVKGIKVNGNIQKSDIVINNTDIISFYHHLLPGYDIPSTQLKQQRSSSAVIFYWAVKGQFPQLDLHNILFSDNYKEEFDHLFKTKTISSDPTVYIFISTRAVESDAPPNSENWYVMINAPENDGQDWDIIIQQVRRSIISKINKQLHTDIEKHIILEAISNPQIIEQTTGSAGGSLYGLSSNSMFSAFNRHPNFLRKFKNLYFSGGSVHPGGGIPLCLASASIIDQEIKPAKSISAI
jgi:phytoene desaturase